MLRCQTSMRWRCAWLLPVCGLVIFCFITARSVHEFREHPQGGLRGGTAQLSPRPVPFWKDTHDAGEWHFYIFNRPAIPIQLYRLAILSAWAVGIAIVFVLGKLDVNEIASFFTLMPALVALWLGVCGSWLDSQIQKVRRAGASALQ